LWDSLLIFKLKKRIIYLLVLTNTLLSILINFIYFYNLLSFRHKCFSKKFLKNYSLENSPLNPWYVIGFVLFFLVISIKEITSKKLAEGCFNINITKSSSNLIGYQVQARFIIEVNIKDIDMLHNIQAFFEGTGSITSTKNVARYSIHGIKDIKNIIRFFDEYPLQSAKQIDFALWKECVELMLCKKHLTTKGLEKILSYKTAMNFGESDKLKLLFPNIISIKRPLVEISNIKLNPFWVSGFIGGEGSFHINTKKNTHRVRPVFSVGLNHKDKPLLIRINKFFKEIGSIYESHTNNSAELKIFKSSGFYSLMDHFSSYPLKGFKLYNFTVWCEIVKLLENKEMTPEILDKINDLKNKLNKWNQ